MTNTPEQLEDGWWLEFVSPYLDTDGYAKTNEFRKLMDLAYRKGKQDALATVPNTYYPLEEANVRVRDMRRGTIEEVRKLVDEVNNVNDSTGRYDACCEIQSLLTHL